MRFFKKMATSTPVKMAGSQILFLGLVGGAGAFFGNAENGQLNTYINGVLRFEMGAFWDWWMVPLMTSCSAIMGLIFMLVWGAYSDNHYSRIGHRKPLLLSGIVAGIAMILYLLSNNFWICFFLDVIVIGIFMNGVLAAQHSMIPELTVQEERGRVNGRISVITGICGVIAIGMFLVADANFTNIDPYNREYLNYEGHFWLLLIIGFLYAGITLGAFFG
nr:MFS transporter [Candidatus Sigynarchaeota archaeon]